MDAQQRQLRKLILDETSKLDLEQVRSLRRRHDQLVELIEDFAPVSLAEYSRMTDEQKQADGADLRIRYILSREIEYGLLRGTLPGPILDWIRERRDELAESNALGGIAPAVGYFLEHQPQVEAVVRRFQAGVLFSRSEADYPKLGDKWTVMPPEQVFLRQDSFPEVVDHLVTLTDRSVGRGADGRESAGETRSLPEEIAFPLSGSGRENLPETGGPSSDEVDCTVFAPPRAPLGQWIMVQVFAHQPASANEARETALEFDQDAARRGVAALPTRILRGSTLTFELLINGAVVQDNVRSMKWLGRVSSVQFVVEMPGRTEANKLIGRLLVAQDSVPIGTIAFTIGVDSEQADPPRPLATGKPLRFRSAFISYASKDRPEVLRRVQMLDAVGIEYFHDLLSLEPGQRWERELYRQIDQNDVLLLFWSTEAKNSKWVGEEWKYALQHKGDDGVLPIVIEGPPPVSPPPELKHLHFCSRFMYFLS